MPLRYSELECRNTQVVDDANYTGLEVCKDLAGQLYYMSHGFDSCHRNETGCGITLPLDCEKEAEFIPDQWYAFEY